MQLDQKQVRQLHEKLQEYRNIFAVDNELHITVRCASFTESLAEFKLHIAPLQPDGTAATRESEDFKHHCFRYDLQPADLGRTFSYGALTYKLVGLNPRSPAYPMVCQDETGKIYKFPAHVVKRHLDAQVKA